MTSRALSSLLAIMLMVVLFSSCAPVWAAGGNQPNIVFILCDDQRLEDIAHMPKLHHLIVDQGMSFNNYFSTVSLCCPSRTTIIRGQYAHNTGVMTNGGNNGGFATAHSLGVENSTIATWLHDANYKTALVGKYLNHYPGDLGGSYVPPGWDCWASPVAGNPYSEYNYTLNENGKQVEYGKSPQDYGTDVYAKKAVAFIKDCAQEKKPFFIYLAFYAPHSPATPAPRHLEMFADAKVPRSKAFNEEDVSKKPQYIQKLPPLSDAEIAGTDAYYGKRLRSLQAVDEAIENVCKTLDETKLSDRTYIVFASDNGYHLGEHRMRRGKQTAYETDIHLPLIVRGPGVKAGSKVDQIAGNIDLAPTFADLAGAKTPDFVDGRSLAPILHDERSAEKNWRKAFLVEHWQMGRDGRSRKRRTAPGGTAKPSGDSPDAAPKEPQSPAKKQPNGPTTSSGGPAASAVKTAAAQSSRGSCCDAMAVCEHCAHKTKCNCDKTSFVAGKNDGTGNGGDGLATVKSNLIEEPDEIAAKTSNDSSNQPEIPQESYGPAPAATEQPATGKGKRRQRRRRKNGGGKALGIPEFHALRGKSTTYVEYTTGEQEYYNDQEDPDQVNNLAGSANKDRKAIESAKQSVDQLKTSGAAAARALENGK
ncbi:MAG TPA: sulfatase [Trichormus sp.]|jgi:arylsulfatase A-like enzyme